MELLQTIVSGGLISVVTGIASTLITMHYQKKQFILEKKLEKYSNVIKAYRESVREC